MKFNDQNKKTSIENSKSISFEHYERSLAQIEMPALTVQSVQCERSRCIKFNAFNVQPTAVNTIGSVAVLNVIILFMHAEFTFAHLHQVPFLQDDKEK